MFCLILIGPRTVRSVGHRHCSIGLAIGNTDNNNVPANKQVGSQTNSTWLWMVSTVKDPPRTEDYGKQILFGLSLCDACASQQHETQKRFDPERYSTYCTVLEVSVVLDKDTRLQAQFWAQATRRTLRTLKTSGFRFSFM